METASINPEAIKGHLYLKKTIKKKATPRQYFPGRGLEEVRRIVGQHCVYDSQATPLYASIRQNQTGVNPDLMKFYERKRKKKKAGQMPGFLSGGELGI